MKMYDLTMKTFAYRGLQLFPAMILSLFLLNESHAKQNSEQHQDDPWSVRMAETIMTRHPSGYGDWDYVTGTVMRGFEELWRKTGEQRYYDYIKTTVDRAITSAGAIRDYRLSDYNIDEINEGRMVLLVYKETGEEKYATAAGILRRQLKEHPRTSEGGFWHKQRYPHQMWLDGLYMGSPFYAEYGKVFDEPAAFDDVVNQLVLMETHSRDDATGLLYHGWDESKTQDWADPMTGRSPSFWGRAIGWYAMALVDVLDFLPQEHTGRDSVLAIVERLAAAVTPYQDDSTGVWWQVVDQPNREGNYREASVSTMLVYFLAKAVRMGYIDQNYLEIAEKGYQGIIDEFVTVNTGGQVNLNKICRTAGLGNGRDGSYEYYVYETDVVSNDGKGVGPFLTASLEIESARNPSSVREMQSEPDAFQLTIENYPNPFNPTTRIAYTILSETRVTISVYNLLGQKVFTLLDEVQSAGQHSKIFDASGLSNGVYLYKIVTNHGVSANKMLYLK